MHGKSACVGSLYKHKSSVVVYTLLKISTCKLLVEFTNFHCHPFSVFLSCKSMARVIKLIVEISFFIVQKFVIKIFLCKIVVLEFKRMVMNPYYFYQNNPMTPVIDDFTTILPFLLKQKNIKFSPRRDLNPRPLSLPAGTLPTEL